MNDKSKEAIDYMISVWDEVTGKTWRDNPDHVQQKFLEAEKSMELKFTQRIIGEDEIQTEITDCIGRMRLDGTPDNELNGFGDGFKSAIKWMKI